MSTAIERPGPPAAPTLTGKKSNSLTLKWTPPDVTGGSPPSGYSLVWDEGDSGRDVASFAEAYAGPEKRFKVCLTVEQPSSNRARSRTQPGRMCMRVCRRWFSPRNMPTSGCSSTQTHALNTTRIHAYAHARPRPSLHACLFPVCTAVHNGRARKPTSHARTRELMHACPTLTRMRATAGRPGGQRQLPFRRGS